MKAIMFVLAACAWGAGGQEPASVVLKVKATAGSKAVPFARVDVKTGGGKAVASRYADAHGRIEFRLPEGRYALTAWTKTVTDCGGTASRVSNTVCLGRAQVSVGHDAAEVSVNLQVVMLP
jgi:hypothetical protein